MSEGLFAASMFPALFILIFLGIPVSFSLVCVAFGYGWFVFDTALGGVLFDRLYGITTGHALAAVPLFVFMGSMLERSSIAEKLFDATQLWLGRLPGGLAVATIAMSAVFAAATGIIGAVEAVVGMMAIPAMMKLGYNKGLISGTICAGGSLGTIIPPSIVVIIYASIAEISIGELFAGIIIPGGLMVVFFIAYVAIRCMICPADGPALEKHLVDMPFSRKIRITIIAVVPAVVLITSVLGAILAGIASPTEAAAVGAVGSILLTIAYRELNWDILTSGLRKTVTVTSMVMMIVVGGTMFSSVFLVSGGNTLISSTVAYFDFGPGETVVLFLFIVFLLGFVLDWVTVVLICLPIFLPLLRDMNIDQIWFAVLVVIVIQTAYLTPPMAPAVFYLKTVAPPEISYKDMYKGVIPFVILEGIVLAIVIVFPQAATYLPTIMVGFD